MFNYISNVKKQDEQDYEEGEVPDNMDNTQKKPNHIQSNDSDSQSNVVRQTIPTLPTHPIRKPDKSIQKTQFRNSKNQKGDQTLSEQHSRTQEAHFPLPNQQMKATFYPQPMYPMYQKQNPYYPPIYPGSIPYQPGFIPNYPYMQPSYQQYSGNHHPTPHQNFYPHSYHYQDNIQYKSNFNQKSPSNNHQGSSYNYYYHQKQSKNNFEQFQYPKQDLIKKKVSGISAKIKQKVQKLKYKKEFLQCLKKLILNSQDSQCLTDLCCFLERQEEVERIIWILNTLQLKQLKKKAQQKLSKQKFTSHEIKKLLTENITNDPRKRTK